MGTTFDIHDNVFIPFSDDHIEVTASKKGLLTLHDKRLGIEYNASRKKLAALEDISGIKKIGSAGIFIANTAEFVLSTEQFGVDDCEAVIEVGGVTATVDRISPTFWYSFRSESYMEMYRDVDDGSGIPLCSLLLEGVDENNCLEYLDKAVFKLGLSAEWSWGGQRVLSWPEIGASEQDPFRIAEGPDEVDHSDDDYRHFEPLNFVNAAMRARAPEERFIFLYRALEFYTTFSMVDFIRGAINKSDSDEAIYREGRKIVGARDDVQISRLVCSIIDRNILELAVEENVIERPDCDLLAKKIYERRNSIAHGKLFSGSVTLSPRFIGDNSLDPISNVLFRLVIECINKWSRVNLLTSL